MLPSKFTSFLAYFGLELEKVKPAPEPKSLSYSEYLVNMVDERGQVCYGLLYEKRHIITSQNCHSENSHIRIMHYDLEEKEDYSIPYLVENKTVFPMISWTGEKVPLLQSFNINLLKLNRDALFPSKLALAPLGYGPPPTEIFRMSWFKNKTQPIKSQIYPIGMGYCHNTTYSHVYESIEFCGFDSNLHGCPDYRGGPIFYESNGSPVLYGLDSAFSCNGAIHS